MDDLASWLEAHSPGNTVVWLLGALAARMWRMRSRIAALEKAIADRDKSLADLAAELDAERKRAEALMTELETLMRTLGGSL